MDSDEATPFFSVTDTAALDTADSSASSASDSAAVSGKMIGFWADYSDSLSKLDRDRLLVRLMKSTSSELATFRETTDAIITPNTALMTDVAATGMKVLWNAPGMPVTALTVEEIGATNSRKFFRGHSSDGATTLFYYADTLISGRIRFGERIVEFRQRPFAQMEFFETDGGKYTPEAAPLVPKSAKPSPPRPEPADDSSATACVPRQLTLLVAATPAATAGIAPDNLATSVGIAVAESEFALGESDIVSDVKYELRYLTNEFAGSSESVVEEITAGASKRAQEFRALVSSTGANAAMLLLRSVGDDSCGRANILTSGSVKAPYGFVLTRCLKNGSLAHELTHVFGANHSSPMVPRFSLESYGYYDATGGFRTIEDVCPAGSSCSDRLNLLSDVSKRVGNYPRGTTSANSAKAFRASACSVLGTA